MAYPSANAIQASIKFQNALDFYKSMYHYKDLVSESSVKASAGNFLSVVAYYKLLRQLFKLIYSYIIDKKPEEAKKIRDVLDNVRIELKISQRLEKKDNMQSKHEQKKRLDEIINILDAQEFMLYTLMKESKLELPLDFKNPAYSIREQE